MNKVKHISPILVVENVEQTVSFYHELLGFEVVNQTEQYAVISRDENTIHLSLAHNEKVMKSVRGHASIYIQVTDVDELWELVSKHKEQYKMRDLFDQPYGMREFHINDPNNCLVFVGQLIE